MNLIGLTSCARQLIWQAFDELWLVYQPSSGETHVFNETTAEILQCLGAGDRSWQDTKASVECALGVLPGALSDDDFGLALDRLYELGLIDSCGEELAHPC